MPTGLGLGPNTRGDRDLSESVKRRAAEDHASAGSVLPHGAIQINGITLFERTYGEDIGEIEVTYSSKGYRALYGFTRQGKLCLYAN